MSSKSQYEFSPAHSPYDEFLSIAARSMQPNAIRRLTPLLARGDIISFAAGAPAFDTFPVEELADIAGRVIRERSLAALQYGPTRGQAALLEQIAATMKQRGIAGVRTSEIAVTTGSQQGLDLVSRVIIDRGDVALVELPSYVGGIIALRNSGAEIVGVRQDDEGIDIAELNEKIVAARAAGRKVKCIYTIANFQNPSGVTVSEERRRKLIDVADAHNLLVIEDDPYYELYFPQSTARRLPLAALNPSRVIYMSSFSKVLAPGLRTAWVRAPEEIARKIETAKEGADLSSSQVDQAIVIEAINSDLIDRRLPGIRQFYADRCKAMLDALDKCAPAQWRWTRPLGGFFLWVETPAGMDATELLPTAIDSGVAYVPGQPFCVDGSGVSSLRLAFSKESPEKIRDGIETLCRVLGRCL